MDVSKRDKKGLIKVVVEELKLEEAGIPGDFKFATAYV